MPGLNSLLSNTTNQTTSLPSWYDTAQQNLASGASTAAGQVPGISGTVVQNEINKLSGPNNPFTQGQTALNTIATGAANPWITDAAGNVTPNTQTAMGGLFAAQRDQLNQLLPNVAAGAESANIGSGQFGSLRGQTAVNKAKADAFANLVAAQNQAALQNQQTGVSAGTGLGTTGQQEAQSNIATGTFQQTAPMAASTSLANIINPMRTGTTVANQTQLSPLNQMGTILAALGGGAGTGAANTLLSGLGITNGLSGLINYLNPNYTGSPFYNTGADVTNPDYMGGTSEGE